MSSDQHSTRTIRDAEWRGRMEARVRSTEVRIDDLRENVRALFRQDEESGKEMMRAAGRIDSLEVKMRAIRDNQRDMEDAVKELQRTSSELVGEMKKVMLMGTIAMTIFSGLIALVVNIASK